MQIGIPGLHEHLNTGIEGLQGGHMQRQKIAGDGCRGAKTYSTGIDLLEAADILNGLGQVLIQLLRIFQQSCTRPCFAIILTARKQPVAPGAGFARPG